MEVRVSGKQIEIGEALPEQVRARLGSAIEKHFEGRANASVVFSREGAFYRADCKVHLDAGAVLTAVGEANDAYRSFDDALEKVEKQARRYKRKLKNHHERAKPPKGELA
ncbi:MAG TPA: ribosome-associated translation inhibitor RaiA [Rhizomicrobium sp.]|nr:ribosome-associated translation inhibitor RaiA [Rhizomicrobium sp.]